MECIVTVVLALHVTEPDVRVSETTVEQESQQVTASGIVFEECYVDYDTHHPT